MLFPKNSSKARKYEFKPLSNTTVSTGTKNNLLQGSSLDIQVRIESNLIPKLTGELNPNLLATTPLNLNLNNSHRLINKEQASTNTIGITQLGSPPSVATGRQDTGVPRQLHNSYTIENLPIFVSTKSPGQLLSQQPNVNIISSTSQSDLQKDFRRNLLLDYGIKSIHLQNEDSVFIDHLTPVTSIPNHTNSQSNRNDEGFDISHIIRDMPVTIERRSGLHYNQAHANRDFSASDNKPLTYEVNRRLEDLELKLSKHLNSQPGMSSSDRLILQEVKTEITQLKGLTFHIEPPSTVNRPIEQTLVNHQLGGTKETAPYDGQIWVAMEEAAELLGITRRAVNRIVEKGHVRTNTLKVPVQVEYEVEKTFVALPDLVQYRESPPKGGRPRKHELQTEDQNPSISLQVEQQYGLFLEQKNQQKLSQQ